MPHLFEQFYGATKNRQLNQRREAGLRPGSLEMPARLRVMRQVPHPERQGCRSALCRLH